MSSDILRGVARSSWCVLVLVMELIPILEAEDSPLYSWAVCMMNG
jgi:hypothetical protein